MGNMKLADWGIDSVKYLLGQIENDFLLPPHEISMRKIAENVGTTPQNIGMAFDTICKVMRKKGFETRAAGRPRVVQITNIN